MKQKWQQTLQKILDSSVFISSFRAKKLLSYLMEKRESGNEEDFSSYAIALEVFDRDVDFDPSIDPIVRVQMGRLRTLLSKFYLNESDPDDVIIEIPKGKYTPSVKKADKIEQESQAILNFPSLYIHPLVKSNDTQEELSNAFQLKLMDRFYANQFYKLTLDQNKADFQIKLLWEEDTQFHIFVFDKHQNLIKRYFGMCQHQTDALNFVQLNIDGFYSPLMLNSGWAENENQALKRIIDFNEEILLHNRYELLTEVIQILQEMIEVQSHPFLLNLLIKFYHFDFHYGLNIYEDPLKLAEDLLNIAPASTLKAEKIWHHIYRNEEAEAEKLFKEFLNSSKHYEDSIQELLFHLYFGDKKAFEESRGRLDKLEYEIPDIIDLGIGIYELLEGNDLTAKTEASLDNQPFNFTIFLIAIGSSNPVKREKSKAILDELLQENKQELMDIVSNWVKKSIGEQLILKYKSIT
ncbi:hypothetical protein MY04_2520 [Flammeovirga sp. MY04]|uniref:hypothetical protein n=1 Tax=Flammeovirga sp. MY04 TaxID=1191459 RepID=UPI0008062F14|nr:hypothetical protein [Flammeovirga sp. MY04]ANQ49889.1 hypothetical protein MY04_2520 [Flammeovirga sp. MY04]